MSPPEVSEHERNVTRASVERRASAGVKSSKFKVQSSKFKVKEFPVSQLSIGTVVFAPGSGSDSKLTTVNFLVLNFEL
jgi:hypothetical protein